MRASVLAAALGLFASAPSLRAQSAASTDPPASASAQDDLSSAAAARRSIDAGVKYLLQSQRADGAWGTSSAESLWELHYSHESFYSWSFAATALSAMALREVTETTERRAALEKALQWLCHARLPKRGNEWDIDSTWGSLYGFQAMVAAAGDERFAAEAWRDPLRARGLELYHQLENAQDPLGGWGYYEGPVVSRRPTWSTSFATACVVPALLRAQRLGWPLDSRIVDRAVRYVERCRMPNGAYLYDLDPIPNIDGGEHINQMKGSLGRTQVCNWALREAGDPLATDARLRAGLDAFFAEHRFLDVARLKPIPHEAYYRNAGYFYYFGHYYAALAIDLLPAAERAALHQRLRPLLIRTQWKDGSSADFIGGSYEWAASTSFSILALQAGLTD